MKNSLSINGDVTIIGAASGWGAQLHKTEDGPNTLFELGLINNLKNWGVSLADHYMVSPSKSNSEIFFPDNKSTLPLVVESVDLVYGSVCKEIAKGHFPIVIGGDHSIAIGTWSGIVTALDAEEEFGLIWVDAHMDSHTMETSPSKAYHGMPVACLLGYGVSDLTSIGKKKVKIKPENLVLIGIRSYERGEENLLNSLGVRVFKIEEVQRLGMAAVFEEALKIVTKTTKGFGVSIDLDAFDPTEAPGVGSPEPNGLKQADFLPEIYRIRNDPKLKGLEFTEFNPHLDKDDKTANLIFDLIKKFTEK